MVDFLRRKEVRTQLNIAPLIDVIFLLIIFFMLSSHFITHPGIKISLPAAETAQLHAEEDIVIYITGEDKIYLNDQEVLLEELEQRLSSKIREVEKRTLIIKADKKIDLGLAVRVMDIAKKAKAEGFVISTTIEEDVQ